jgi:putative ABC transport system permease protein
MLFRPPCRGGPHWPRGRFPLTATQGKKTSAITLLKERVTVVVQQRYNRRRAPAESARWARCRRVLALQEIRRRKVQFGLISLIVGLVVYLLVMISALGTGLLSAMSGAVNSFDADLVVFSADSNDSLLRSELTAEQRDAIVQLAGAGSTGAAGYMAATVQEDSAVEDVALFGFQLASIAVPRVRSGRALQGDGEILIDRSLSRSTDLSVGDQITMRNALIDYQLTIVGEVDEGQFLGLPSAYVVLDQWREMRYPGQAGNVPAASVLLVRGDTSVLGAQIEAAIPNTSVLSKSDAISAIGGVTEQERVVMAIEFFSFVIGVLVIGSFFFVLTMQRGYEIAIFKALGASSWYVFGQLIRQVVAVAMVGLALGVPLALMTDAALPGDIPLEITGGAFLTGGVSITIAALLGSLLSARQVVRVNPMSALGQV